MNTKFIEVENHGPDGSQFNWGKFMVGQFDSWEWERKSQVDGLNFIRGRGWTGDHILILDMETGEGAIFFPGGYAKYDLEEKHQIWTCPMFLPFMNWLYAHWGKDVTFRNLPTKLELSYDDAPPAMTGSRGHRNHDAQKPL